MRQSTTQKVTVNVLIQLFNYLPKIVDSRLLADGIIVRYRGEEFAIVDCVDGWLIPCPILHPNASKLHYKVVTIRKGLTLNMTQIANRRIAVVLACSINELDIQLNRLCENDNPISAEKFECIQNMILEGYDHVWELKRS
jgi:hypothetical protein